MSDSAYQIYPSLLGVGSEINGDSCAGSGSGGDADVLRSFSIRRAVVTRIHGHVCNCRRATSEATADIGGHLVVFGKDRDSLSGGGVCWGFVKLGDGCGAEWRCFLRVGGMSFL